MNQGIEGAPSCSGRGVVDLFFMAQERLAGGRRWAQYHTANRTHEERRPENQRLEGQTQHLVRQQPSD